MARDGIKTIHFPVISLEDTLDFIKMVKKKVIYLSLQMTMKRDTVSIKLRGPQDKMMRAMTEIKGLYIDLVKSKGD